MQLSRASVIPLHFRYLQGKNMVRDDTRPAAGYHLGQCLGLGGISIKGYAQEGPINTNTLAFEPFHFHMHVVKKVVR